MDSDTDIDADADSESDADSDADTDAEGDPDSDADTDAESGSASDSASVSAPVSVSCPYQIQHLHPLLIFGLRVKTGRDPQPKHQELCEDEAKSVLEHLDALVAMTWRLAGR